MNIRWKRVLIPYAIAAVAEGDRQIIEQRWGIGSVNGCKQPLSKVAETVHL